MTLADPLPKPLCQDPAVSSQSSHWYEKVAEHTGVCLNQLGHTGCMSGVCVVLLHSYISHVSVAGAATATPEFLLNFPLENDHNFIIFQSAKHIFTDHVVTP